MGTVAKMSIKEDLETAQQALKDEANAIIKMADELGEDYIQAINILQDCKGRVIVTGMGKSGHVARKIAATLASTGTPAYFVHPSEASHGDLGMIDQTDVVIGLSNSGETKELKDVLAFTQRFSIPLISITSNRNSALAKHSTVVLELPKAPEVCPTGKAPTTSTTMTMALGDAIAVTLMYRNGFTKDDFGVFHPGGKLGASIFKVSDVMRPEQELPLVTLVDTVDTVLNVMSSKGQDGRAFGRAIVVDEQGDLVGFVSDGDIRRHIAPNLHSKKVQDIMTADPKRVDQSDLAAKALAIMNELSITELIVADGQKPIGMVRLHDILKAGIA